MPRTKHNPTIRTKTQRLKDVEVRRDPYWYLLAEGQHIGYRKIRQGHGTWVARYNKPGYGRRFASLGTADDSAKANDSTILTFEQAERKAKAQFQTWDEIDSGEIAIGAYTVAQAMADYIERREREKRKPLKATRAAVQAHIVPQLGDLQVVKLTRGKIEQWHEALADAAPRVRTRVGKPQAYRSHDPGDADALRRRQATANRILTVLKAALNHAHHSRRVTAKPWESVKPFRKVDVPKVHALTAAEVETLLDHCADDFRKLVRAALLTGCRYGELAAMRVEHYDSQQQQVFVAESKNGEARHVELSDAGVELFEQLTRGQAKDAWMFVRANGKQWKKSEQKRPMDEACAKAEIEQVTFHILRHTYASHLAMAGVTLRTIADQLGHKDTRITERHYAHLSRQHVRDSIRKHLPAF